MIKRSTRIWTGVFLAIFSTVALAQFWGIPRRLFALVVTSDLTIEGDAVVEGTTDLQGNVSDSTGVFTIFDSVDIDGTLTTGSPVIIESSSGGALRLTGTGAAVDEKQWRLHSASGQLQFQTRTDASGVGATAILIDRTGTTVDTINLQATTITSTGNSIVTGTSDFQGDISNSTGELIIADSVLFTSPVSGATSGLQTSNAQPGIYLNETDAAVDNRRWLLFVTGETFIGRIVSDDIGSVADWLTVNRTANTIDSINLVATDVQVNGRSVQGMIICSRTYDPADIASGSNDISTFTCTGAAVGDLVFGHLESSAGLVTARVSAANTIQMTIENWTNGNLVYGSSNWQFLVITP